MPEYWPRTKTPIVEREPQAFTGSLVEPEPPTHKPLPKPGKPYLSTRVMRELAGRYTVSSIETLVWLRDNAEESSVRLQAATALLDRAHGKPVQGVALEDDEGGNQITIIVQGRTVTDPASKQVTQAEPQADEPNRVNP